MRVAILALFLCVATLGLAQAKQIDKVRISSAKFADASQVSEILPDSLGACLVLSYHFYANLGNTVKSMDVKGGEITPLMKTVVKELRPGEKFVIESLRYSCPEPHKKNYVFIIK